MIASVTLRETMVTEVQPLETIAADWSGHGVEAGYSWLQGSDKVTRWEETKLFAAINLSADCRRGKWLSDGPGGPCPRARVRVSRTTVVARPSVQRTQKISRLWKRKLSWFWNGVKQAAESFFARQTCCCRSVTGTKHSEFFTLCFSWDRCKRPKLKNWENLFCGFSADMQIIDLLFFISHTNDVFWQSSCGFPTQPAWPRPAVGLQGAERENRWAAGPTPARAASSLPNPTIVPHVNLNLRVSITLPATMTPQSSNSLRTSTQPQLDETTGVCQSPRVLQHTEAPDIHQLRYCSVPPWYDVWQSTN